jgi:hypothetical protein
MHRYHVSIDGRRTTVSLTPTLAELLALKLGADLDAPQAHAAVRTWLQGEVDRDPGAVAYGRASQRLAHLAMLAIAAPGLVAKLERWQASKGG